MEEKINSVKKEFTILEIEELDGLTIGKNDEKITIYDASLKEQMVANYFDTKYRNLLCIILDINASDDSTESDEYLVREKINELRNLLVNSYAKYIDEKSLGKYMKMLFLLEEKIVSKSKGKIGR